MRDKRTAKAGGPIRVVLARGVCMSTARVGNVVVRQPRWWCRFLFGPLLVARLVRTAGVFRDFVPVPPTRFVRRRLGGFALVQRYVKGAVPLRKLSDAQLAGPAVLTPLRALLARVEECYRRTGWMPDIGGRVYVPGELYNIRRTDNLVLGADGRWWLVDIGATALFHCRKWPTGWLHTQLLMSAVRRFDKELAQWSAGVVSVTGAGAAGTGLHAAR